MRLRRQRLLLAAIVLIACGDDDGTSDDAGASTDVRSPSDLGAVEDTGATSDVGPPVVIDAGEPLDLGLDAGTDASFDAGTADAGPTRATLGANRDRLLETYLGFLREDPDRAQSNGLRGSDLANVCDLWDRLDPSARAVFLTITARLSGSHLGDDDSAMLDHLTRLYRLVGGEGATATDPGSCGMGDSNRMILSMDAQLHGALVAANANRGVARADGRFDLADVTTFWRDSHDLGGSHPPFDASDETDDGAPRGQVQYFGDPSSTLANGALGRLDLETLVDPYAFEMDQDYDCVHASNPLCEYTFYGPACLPAATSLGTDIYTSNYGDFEPGYRPSGC